MNKHMLKAFIPAACAAFASAASAYNGEIGGLNVNNTNTFTVGSALRLQDRDPAIIGTANGGTSFSTNHDDGDLAFGEGKPIASVSRLTSDLTVSKGDYGVFVRGNWLFDPTLYNHTYFNAANYGPGKSATMAEYDERTRAVQHHLGNSGRLLDAYVYGSIPLGDRNMSVRLGNQVLNWGESTFVLNGINSFVAADANKLRVPGFQLSEVYTPVPLALISMPIYGNTSFEAFYQFQWKETIPDAVGSYFSTQDFAGIGAMRANLGFGQAPENTPNTTVPRAPDRDPKDSGQFGVRIDTQVPQLNAMDLSLYAVQYHSRLPLLSGMSKATFGAPSETASYFEEYPENIRLYGLSFNTTLPGDFALQGEYSFKQGQPLQIDDVELLLTGLGVPSQLDPVLGDSLGSKYIRGWRRHNISQANLGITRIIGPVSWLHSQQILILGEVADMYVHTLPSPNELRYDGPGTDTPGDCTLEAAACTGPVTQNIGGYATRNSWGYRLLTRVTYNNVISGLTLEPTLLFAHDVNGISPGPVATFVGGTKTARASVAAHYLDAWSGELAYVNFFGGGAHNLSIDRDYMELSLKYSF